VNTLKLSLTRGFLYTVVEKTNMVNVVCFLLGNSQASEFYIPTFQNTLAVPSSQAGSHLPARETLAYKIQTLGNNPEQSIQRSKHGKSLK
jgi:hypothetical protein